MLEVILKFAIAGFAVAFLVLFTLAIVRRRRAAASARLFRAGTGSLALAGLLFILAGAVGKGDMTSVACGLMFLVLATGIEFRPKGQA